MGILVVGSVALDTVSTPFGQVRDVLGGSAVYFSCAASYFNPVRIVAVVGNDFPHDALEFLGPRGVDTSGIARAAHEDHHLLAVRRNSCRAHIKIGSYR